MLGDRIKYFRLLKGMKQTELSALLFVSPNYISAIEKGRKLPSLQIVLKLFELLDCSPNELFEYEPQDAADTANVPDGTVDETVKLMRDLPPEAKFKVFSYAKDQSIVVKTGMC